jgi:tetratricopeptide (TPR) repeat protein
MWRIAVVVLAGALAYANALRGPFIYDDAVAVVGNEHIRTLQFPDALFADRENPAAGRPVVNLSFALNYAAAELNPVAYHVTNLALHLLCAVVLFALARRTFASDNIAFAIALLWVVHPLNSEVVDYVTERSESLMALFFLLTLCCAARARSPQGLRDRNAWTACAIGACAIGMACKETMAVAPLVVMAYDRAFTFDSWSAAFRARWRLYAGLAATWTVLAALLATGPRIHSAGFTSEASPWTNLLNQTVMIVRYLRLAAWPRELVVNYGWPRPLTVGDVLPQALLVVALLSLTIAAAARWPRLACAGVWFFLILAPTSSFIPIATEVGAERRMYLPLVALVALAVVGINTLRRRLRAPVAATMALLTLSTIALAAATLDRNREYASQAVLAETTRDRWPSPTATAMVGLERRDAGRTAEAIDLLREAGAAGYPPAWYHAGGLLMTAGRVDEALAALQTFVEQAPMVADAVPARLMMGRALLARHQVQAARVQAEQARAMDRSSVDAVGLLADCQLAAGEFDGAIANLQIYLARRPGDVAAAVNYGIALASSGRPREAMAAFQRARDIDPRDPRPHKNIAALALNSNDLQTAGLAAEDAVKAAPSDAEAYDLLGRALAEAGRIADARAAFERALVLDANNAQARADLELLKKVSR